MPALTDLLVNPVLSWSVKRATRGNLWRGLQIAYCAWLLIQAVAMFGTIRYASHWDGEWSTPSALQRQRERDEVQTQFLNSYLESLLKYQLVIVIAITPAVTASSLGPEKERGTLLALFCTQLTSWQILAGILIGRLILLVPMIVTIVPALVFILAWTDRDSAPVYLAMLQQAILIAALGSFGILVGIWIRRAADAVVLCYVLLGLAYGLLVSIAALTQATSLLSPIDSLNNLLKDGLNVEFAVHLILWAFLGGVCLRVGLGRLRDVCLEQQDAKPPRRIWAFRPAVGNDPIRWRECYVIGLAPLPFLHFVPRWLAVLGVFVGASALNAVIALQFSPDIPSSLSRFDFAAAIGGVQPRIYDYHSSIGIMGLVFILLGGAIIGVRCGMSVREEKRRNTWDDLLLTAQSFREIITGKMWGILQAVVPYVAAYALPVFLLAWMGGTGTLIAAAAWILLPCAIVFVAALSGIDMVRVPPDMDETRETGAFSYERRSTVVRRKLHKGSAREER